jgi:hypothetical protein
MIANDFVFELSIDLDFKKIKDIVLENQFNIIENIASHQRLVKDSEYLSSMRDKYPFLCKEYNIYTIQGKRNIPIHIDAERSCALNIPIENTRHTSTIFYQLEDDTELEYVESRVYNLVKTPVKEIFRFSLIKPTIINNKVPHSVINYTANPRIVLSWSIQKEYDFKTITSLMGML